MQRFILHVKWWVIHVTIIKLAALIHYIVFFCKSLKLNLLEFFFQKILFWYMAKKPSDLKTQFLQEIRQKTPPLCIFYSSSLVLLTSSNSWLSPTTYLSAFMLATRNVCVCFYRQEHISYWLCLLFTGPWKLWENINICTEHLQVSHSHCCVRFLDLQYHCCGGGRMNKGL